MQAELTAIEIKILLTVEKKLSLSKTEFSQLYRYDDKERKYNALRNLIEKHFIAEKMLPKPGARKTPVFFEITETGKEWVKNYLANYPK